ncbi:unnamed protein product [Vitrella brassicaformis CCMP3155]|uniref:DNA polymerase epsilon catalytic subunit n=4 Tax=Vitrella brassicaformis TaxID=1169539 RepID=A0A0G4EHJ2_VITBC|nr:unnamed protein product [Vitrella brassicaformis CCMP3155]|eukprot:CEL95962.1 unnamed protein product [Vitrella brassicaformis CCMP3155]
MQRGWDNGNRRVRPEYREDRVRAEERWLEDKLGVEVLPCYGTTSQRAAPTVRRDGWLLNVKATTVAQNMADRKGDAAVWLFAIDKDGKVFRTTFRYAPYFYVEVAQEAGVVQWVVDFLDKKFGKHLVGMGEGPRPEKVLKEDLAMEDHLRKGNSKTFIKLTFRTVEDLQEVKREINGILKANERKQKGKIPTTSAADEFANLLGRRAGGYDDTTAIRGLYEADVLYVQRVCIDNDIRCGKWYTFEWNPPNNLKLRCLEGNGVVHVRPEVRCLAWDIETTKEKLKFPDATYDEIMMVSYMMDGAGFLIVNRAIVKADIEDFEYTPKPEFQGNFTVYNVENERALLRRFFDDIRDLQPLVFVTFNGDYFDFPFVAKRAEIHGMKLWSEIGVRESKEAMDTIFSGRFSLHIDCLYWVRRDSYLPQGSQGLKAVTRSKLKYDPVELDPELMQPYAEERPQDLATYSVSDAVATYYLYKKYIQDFIFALGTIIPMHGDDVLRKGSGTLCEQLLMAEAYRKNIVFPNKHKESPLQFHNGHLLESTTYVGGRVESLLTGIYRSDLKESFNLNPTALQQRIDELDKTLDFYLRVENDVSQEDVENFDEVRQQILQALTALRDEPKRQEEPLIYHLDVGAMYPNIILTNRLQPSSIVTEDFCNRCSFFSEAEVCQRHMEWTWKGELYMASKADYNNIRAQIEYEKFPPKAAATGPTPGGWRRKQPAAPTNAAAGGGGGDGDGGGGGKGDESEDEGGGGGGGVRGRRDRDDMDVDEQGGGGKDNADRRAYRRWHDLTEQEQADELIKRIRAFSQKAYKRLKKSEIQLRTNIVAFRDRRYEYKKDLKKWRKRGEEAEQQQDLAKLAHAKDMELLYDSLQLAHKCILNSFYGYVMRKGARWYSMPMAGIVTKTGADLIKEARVLVDGVGKPLELDTDGVWCMLPKTFPETFYLKLRDGRQLRMQYPCVVLNQDVNQRYSNNQYLTYVPERDSWERSTECSIFFEIDGPYRAMVIPASQEEDRLLKKRYAVFNFDGSLAELKGFEIKRRGELKLIKVFQEEVFPAFLEGTTREEAYAAVGAVANRWLDVLDSKGHTLTDDEVIDLISESKSMSKSVKEAGSYKSVSVTTATRLAEVLGEQLLYDKGVVCHLILSEKPIGDPVSTRAIPVTIFNADEVTRNHYLRKWLKDPQHDNFDIRGVIDWKYYKTRLGAAVLKIISIPAAFQAIANPVPRIVLPDWLNKRLKAKADAHRQRRLTEMFKQANAANAANKRKAPQPPDGNDGNAPDDDSGAVVMMDIEDLTTPHPSAAAAAAPKKPAAPQQRDIRTDRGVAVGAPAPPGPPPAPQAAEPAVLFAEDPKRWMKQQKKKWKQLRSALKANMVRRRRGARQQKRLDEGEVGIEAFFGRQRENLLTYDWQVLSVRQVPNDMGLLLVWVTIAETKELFKIFVRVKRRLVINTASPRKETAGDEDDGTGGSSGIRCKGVVCELPRGATAVHCYELEMDENDYHSYGREDAQFLNEEDIIGVYETQMPQLLSFVVRYGSLLSLRSSESAKLSLKTSYFEEPQLQPHFKPARQYLPNIPCFIFVKIACTHNSKMYCASVFCTERREGMVIFGGPPPPDRPDFGRVLAAKDFFRQYGQWKIDSHYTKNAANAHKALAKHITDLSKKGLPSPFMLLQTTLDDESLGEFWSSSCPLPWARLPDGFPQDDDIPPLQWTIWAARRSADRCIAAMEFAIWRLNVARMCKIPMGAIMEMTDADLGINVLDILFARALKEHKMVWWCSWGCLPEVGLPPDTATSSVFDPSEKLPFQPTNCAGAYRATCVKFKLDKKLCAAAIRECRQLSELSGVDEFFSAAHTSSGALDSKPHRKGIHPTATQAAMGTQGSSSSGGGSDGPSSGALLLKAKHQFPPSVATPRALSALKSVVDLMMDQGRVWSDAANFFLMQLHRWLSTPQSAFHDPALQRKVADYERKLFSLLLGHIRRVTDVSLVYGDLDELILCTGRIDPQESGKVVESLTNQLALKKMFRSLNLSAPDEAYVALLWLDRSNWTGILADTDDDGRIVLQTSAISEWQMACFLPDALSGAFIKHCAEFLFKSVEETTRIYNSKIDQGGDAAMSSGGRAGSSSLNEQLREAQAAFMKEMIDGWHGRLLRFVGDIEKNRIDCIRRAQEAPDDEFCDASDEDEDDEEFASLETRRQRKIQKETQRWELPVRPADLPAGSHHRHHGSSLQLLFIRYLMKVFSQDTLVADEVTALRRDLLSLVKVKEFSPEGEWRPPCKSLVLRDIECSHCHRVCDMDLTTDEWACPAEECHADYEPEYIESRLVQEIEERVQHFQNQEVLCRKCRQVQLPRLPRTCHCAGAFVGRIDVAEIREFLESVRYVAENHPSLEEGGWLAETVGFADSVLSL